MSHPGGTTADGAFTLEDAECLALCGNAPLLTVNWRYFGDMTPGAVGCLGRGPPAGRLDGEVPPHGTLCRVRRTSALAASAGPGRARPGERPATQGRAGGTRDGTYDAGRGRASVGGPPCSTAGEDAAGADGGRDRMTHRRPSPKTGPRIVTSRFGLPRSWTLASYLDNGGYEGLRKALAMTPEDVHQATLGSASSGGVVPALTPAASGACCARPEPVYLVVNGDESEPATFKDHALIEGDPHQLIEGSLICAYAIRAAQVFIFVRGEMALAQERLQAALNEAYEYGAVGANIFGSGFSVDIVVHPGAGAYICGEETALLESLEGKRGYPRIKPPYYPAAVGLYGAPTWSTTSRRSPTCPGSCCNGSEAFAALGEGRSTGTKIWPCRAMCAGPATTRSSSPR